jgi:hypothetical protein
LINQPMIASVINVVTILSIQILFYSGYQPIPHHAIHYMV